MPQIVWQHEKLPRKPLEKSNLRASECEGACHPFNAEQKQ